MPKMSDRLNKGVEMHGPFSPDKTRLWSDLIQEVERNRKVIKKLICLLPRCLAERSRRRLINELDGIDEQKW